ncbi:4-(cytidine 5'-diphospho)-2-C-methyl-D-erythritol kinase [Achromobacter denitrificans]|uniref:4-diphosphocytidyl-2-C-methyl-D-erythritol kinase n=1 Tax=Achromobacter denitrificans TaxID=32002 RepID=A0A427WHJ7_ACHDE|nr:MULTISPECIES: 4-(cytidine 5'-diphospho)-2-C-methyl-D-erythritol kinase [Achromobacter]ASC68830.1 4-(cytidine 5'-diphospho)-2-C-methyl-D-erythritol kinase [Achromobacter denitrificans]MDF3847201.1 4-(cytidine 5'-diphospho)-2-C-methyl-D-erythritol kinase [Achromobacter denitrificans]MDF3861292.1 4-(cytidine 5'-diphospho)-2-C-methyl-D-erythritol kinase [Achromobacter denitrificans]OLU00617.1 4-(cytidine 5'-diphospho)-2-C-methyl-D-erythritol kinase [Achromobacter denitrificans]QKH43324.1 4-(cyt
MTLYDVPAPAKVNLFLHVVGRRADGYHLLQTAFRFIDLCDTLHFDLRADGGIGRSTDLPGVPPEQDLTLRAAHALQRATGTRQGVQIGLEKRIPQGGGLGGGSSDAATVLIALNRLWGTGLSRRELMALALPLGADVPVFVFGQSAFAQGVGEELAAVTLPERAYLVAQPDASVPTAEIFSAPDLTRDSSYITIADFLASPTFCFGRNDLEPVVYRLYPEVLGASRWLAEQLKPRGVAVRMSGSGACLYAEFSELSEAVLAKTEITAIMRGADKTFSQTHPRFRLVQACTGLAEHPLRNWIAR